MVGLFSRGFQACARWSCGRPASQVLNTAGVAEADVLVLLCDGQAGPTAADEEVIDWMRRVHSAKPVILAINKCESATQGELQAASFWNYGLQPLAVSAISGAGTGLLMERLIEVCCCAKRRSFMLLR